MNQRTKPVVFWSVVCGLLAVAAASGPVIRKATQTEVNSGTNDSAFVTPLTLAIRVGSGTIITSTNGFKIDSNSWVNVPTTISGLAEGQVVFVSKQGIPFVIWKVGGVLTTNRLDVANSTGSVNATSGLTIPSHIASDTVGYQKFVLHKSGDTALLEMSVGWLYNPTNDTVIGNGGGLTNVTADAVTDAITNQWRIDATNALAGGSNVTINVNTVNTTNLTVQNTFTGKSSLVQNFYGGDGTFTNGVYFYTNSWSGPTNPIDLRLEDQYYDTVTPLSITGFQNKSNTVSQTVVLTIRNLSSTNVTCFLPANVRTALFTNSFTIAPTSEAVLSMKYSPSGPRTNAITQAFYP